jgi:hypothetical protein
MIEKILLLSAVHLAAMVDYPLCECVLVKRPYPSLSPQTGEEKMAHRHCEQQRDEAIHPAAQRFWITS